MKLKIVAVFLTITFALVLLSVPTAADDAESLVIVSSSATGERGETVTVTLSVESNPGVAALLIAFSNLDGFEIETAKNGSILTTMTSGRNILWDSISNSQKLGTLVTLTLKICEDASFGENCISVNAVECYNKDGAKVSVTVSPIIINVLGGAAEDETDTFGESDSLESESGSEDVGTSGGSASEEESSSDLGDNTESENDDATENCNESESGVIDTSVEGDNTSCETDCRDGSLDQVGGEGGCTSAVGGGALGAIVAGYWIFSQKKKK